MAENVILQGHKIKRSRSSMKVKNILHRDLHSKSEASAMIHVKYTSEVSSRSYLNSLSVRWKNGQKGVSKKTERIL